MNTLIKWLMQDQKSIRQKAGELGVSHAHLAKLVRGDVPVTWEFAATVAFKTGLDPIRAFEMAGLLMPACHGSVTNDESVTCRHVTEP